MIDESSKQVLDWLAREGFPLEVRVGKACRTRDWLTFHEFPYTDAAEGKLRTCDVYATRYRQLQGGSTLSVDLAIECKRSATKPWVVFAEPVKTSDWYMAPMLAPGRVSEVTLGLLRGEPDPLDFLRPQGWVGYNVAKAHINSKDGDPTGAYSALRSTISAAEALALRCERTFDAHHEWPPSIAITLPVLVVGAPLYLYTLDEENEEHLEKITAAKVVAPMRRFEARSLLTIVAEEGFPAWLEGLTRWTDAALEKLVPIAHVIPKLVLDDQNAAALMA